MPAAPPAGSRCLRWIARHPVAALLLWFFTVGQAVAFVPAVASSYRALGPVHLFAFVPIGLVVAVATHGRLALIAATRPHVLPPDSEEPTMALDRRTRLLGAVLRRAAGPVTTMPASKRQALRAAKAPRVLTDHLHGRPAADVTATDCSLPSASGPLGVRIHRPDDRQRHDLPSIVAFRGGGCGFGLLDTAQWLCSEVAARVPAVVAGTYRLAPEHPAPAALEDAFAITAWAVEHARDLGASRHRVAVMGESSGGTLAASVALHARDTGAFALRCQALIHPITDLTLTSPSIRLSPGEPVLTSWDLAAYVQAYLGPDGSPSDPYVSPRLAEDHHGLPPAVVISADHDPLRDDARRYAERLRASGVPVECIELVDSPHGAFTLPNLCRASGPGLDAGDGVCVEHSGWKRRTGGARPHRASAACP